jgi:mannosyltransferase
MSSPSPSTGLLPVVSPTTPAHPSGVRPGGPAGSGPAGGGTAWRLGAGTAGVLGLVAALVTMTGSWIPSLWGDEAATDLSAQRSWASLWYEVRHVDAVHATYYAFMHVWIKLAGTSAFALRLPSAIALGLAVVGVFLLVRLCDRSRTTAVIAAVATFLLPRLAYQGAEARAYAMDATLATWILVAAVATLRGRIRPRVGWVLVGALTVVGTYLFMYVGLMAGVVALLALCTADRWRNLRAWAITTAAVLVAILPLVALGYSERAQVSFLAHRVTTDPYSVWVTTFFWSAKGWSNLATAVGWVLVAIALVAAAVPAARTWRARRALEHGSAPAATPGAASPGLATVATLWALVPTAFLIVANPVLHDFSARYGTFTAPGVAILMALGVDALLARRRWVGLVAAAVGVGSMGVVWVNERGPTSYNASDWAIISGLVKDHAQPGDEVAFDTTVRPSRRMLLAMRTYPQDYTGLESVQVTTPYWDNDSWDDRAMTVDQAVSAGRFDGARIWLLQDAHGGTPDTEGEKALEQDGYRIVQTWRAPSSQLVELER